MFKHSLKKEGHMAKGKIVTEKDDIKNILKSYKTIAVLGLSPKTDRASNMVARFLIEKGYDVIPVRPKAEEILGKKAYGSLDEIEVSVDIVDAFRRSEQIKEHIDEVIRLKPKVFWMQEGIYDLDSAKILNENGIDVVMDRCIKIDYQDIFEGVFKINKL